MFLHCWVSDFAVLTSSECVFCWRQGMVLVWKGWLHSPKHLGHRCPELDRAKLKSFHWSWWNRAPVGTLWAALVLNLFLLWRIWRCKQSPLKGISFSFLFSILHPDHVLIQRWCQKGNHFTYALLQVKYRRVKECWSMLELVELVWQPFSWWDWQKLFPSWQQELKRNWKQQQTREQLWGSTTRMKILVKRSWHSPKVRISIWKTLLQLRRSVYLLTCMHIHSVSTATLVSEGADSPDPVSQPSILFSPRMYLSLVWLRSLFCMDSHWLQVHLGHKYCACVIVASTRNCGTKSLHLSL